MTRFPSLVITIDTMRGGGNGTGGAERSRRPRHDQDRKGIGTSYRDPAESSSGMGHQLRIRVHKTRDRQGARLQVQDVREEGPGAGHHFLFLSIGQPWHRSLKTSRLKSSRTRPASRSASILHSFGTTRLNLMHWLQVVRSSSVRFSSNLALPDRRGWRWSHLRGYKQERVRGGYSPFSIASMASSTPWALTLSGMFLESGSLSAA